MKINGAKSYIWLYFYKMELEILFEDEYLIAINKPSGLLVHRTSIAASETVFALQLLRDQIGQHVHPVHRLDRPTSGVLLFAKNEEILPTLKLLFSERRMEKSYLTVVRGIPALRESLIDHPLKSERSGRSQEAQTHYKVISESEMPFNSTGRYPTSRYSLLSVKPETGRTHQIRRHMAHIRHYILGDKKHGDNKQNIFLEKEFGLTNLLLHAQSLSFIHPKSNEKLEISCPAPLHFQKMVKELDLEIPSES